MEETEEKARESEVQYYGIDGTALRGTLRAAREPQAGVLLVHGLTGDRDENGLYVALADRLDGLRATSLRFDLRGHGQSAGRYEDVTLSGVASDIGSAYEYLTSRLPAGIPTFVVAASFAGGLAACWAAAEAASAAAEEDAVYARHDTRLCGLVLLCPLFDYGKRMLFSSTHWTTGRGLDDDGVDMVRVRGWLDHHTGGFRIGSAMLNEFVFLRPQDRVGDLDVPLLTIHADADDVAPYGTSNRCTWRADDPDFVTIKGAGHMFVHHDDNGDCKHPATQRFRDAVCDNAVEWIGDRV